MRILQVSAFHYLRGGVERTCLDESRWLAAAGHEVAHFAIRDPRNLPSPTADYFAPAADFGEGAPALRQLAQLPRALWSRPAAAAMARLLGTFRPDVAHVHAPSRYLTPSVLRPLERARVPIVMTLHDYKPWCTNRVLFAHGEPCERCRGGGHWHAAATGCVQGSRLKSAVATVEAYLHDWIGAYRAVRLWIAPSQFAAEKAVSLGLDRARVRVLGHGVERGAPGAPPSTLPSERFVLFAGRLTVDKGVRLLPAIAATIAPAPVVVAGDGPLASWLAREGGTGVRQLGHLPCEALAAVMSRATAVIVPSLFYETFGYAVAEPMAEARPVVAARIGALPELVEHEVTGLLARPGDADELAALTLRALYEPRAAEWGENARRRIAEVADPRRHLQGLLAIYGEAASA
ncbi:MAG TPA: glycosyltransferase [Candidatus Eisenbacteria bacterium]